MGASEGHKEGVMFQRSIFAAAIASGLLVAPSAFSQAPVYFARGDANADSRLNVADPVFILLHLFDGGDPPPCQSAADANDNGRVEIGDPVFVLGFLFDGMVPSFPLGECAVDLTPDGLGCNSFAPCAEFNQTEFERLVVSYDELTTLAGLGDVTGGGENGWQPQFEGAPATEVGRAGPGTENHGRVGRDLLAAVPHCGDEAPRRADHGRARGRAAGGAAEIESPQRRRATQRPRPTMPSPSTACHIQESIGAWNAAAFDMNSACSGFVFSFTIASQFLKTGMYRNVLVVGVESLSTILNYKDRNTCVIFGDGAGAMLLQPFEVCKRGEALSMSMYAEGGNDDTLCVPAGGSKMPASPETLEKDLHSMVMGGNKVYRFAVNTFAKMVRQALEPYAPEELGKIVPHQVNLRIFEAAMERLDMPMDYVYSNIHKYGNTAAASVPMAFDEAYREGALEKGKLVVSAAFGAGLTWGHFLVRW